MSNLSDKFFLWDHSAFSLMAFMPFSLREHHTAIELVSK
jgi:hypothetical protein